MIDRTAGERREVAARAGELGGDLVRGQAAQPEMARPVRADLQARRQPVRDVGTVHVAALTRCLGRRIEPFADEEHDGRQAERREHRHRHVVGVRIAVVEGDQEGALPRGPTRGQSVTGRIGIDEIAMAPEQAQLVGETLLQRQRDLVIA